MTQGVKMKKMRGCRMALLVPVKGKTLINLVVVVVSAEEETMNPMMQTTTIVRKESQILVKDELLALVTGRTEANEEEVLVDLGMKNVVVVEVEVAVDVGEEEEALVVDEVEENLIDTVEVTERKCCANVNNNTF